MLALRRANQGDMDIQVCWVLAFPPIGFSGHHAEPSPPGACLDAGSVSACLALTVFALEGEVGSGLGWDALNLLPYFPNELTSATGKGCPAPPVPGDRLGTHLRLSLLQGFKLNVEPGPSWGCVCFLHYPFKLFKQMFSKILKKKRPLLIFTYLQEPPSFRHLNFPLLMLLGPLHSNVYNIKMSLYVFIASVALVLFSLAWQDVVDQCTK